MFPPVVLGAGNVAELGALVAGTEESVSDVVMQGEHVAYRLQ
jgi:hypothetical protein